MQYKRLGITEDALLDSPTFEFFYKDAVLHDPMIDEDHIRTFGWVDAGRF